MGNKKTKWEQYTKDELIQIIQYAEKVFIGYAPWVLLDAESLIREKRYLALREEEKRLMDESGAARMKIHELLGDGKDDPETWADIQRLSNAAAEADKALVLVERRIGRHLGI